MGSVDLRSTPRYDDALSCSFFSHANRAGLQQGLAQRGLDVSTDILQQKMEEAFYYNAGNINPEQLHISREVLLERMNKMVLNDLGSPMAIQEMLWEKQRHADRLKFGVNHRRRKGDLAFSLPQISRVAAQVWDNEYLQAEPFPEGWNT